MTLSISKAWDEASAFLAREGRLVAPVAVALLALPSALMGWAYPGNTGPGSGGAGGALLLLAMLLAVLTGQMTIILLAIGWSGKVGDALRQSVRRLLPLLAASLIIFVPLCVVGIVVLGFALAGSGLNDPAQLTPEALVALPAVRWMVLLVLVILLIIGTRLFPLSAVAVAEPVGPLAMLKRSIALTKGHFWRLLALLLLIAVAAMILDWAVTAVVGSVATLALGEVRPFNLSALLVALASGLIGAMVSAVSAAMVGRVYVQLAGERSAA